MRGVVSTPLYPFSHSGPVLVCGGAQCLFEDIKRARSILGEVPIIAVNGAAKLVPAVAIYSKHPEKFVPRRWLEGQQFHFGKTTVHADIRASTRPSCVEYWWEGLWGGGGSAWDARKLAAFLGFSPVVLCGCPMIAGPSVGSLGFGSFMHREDITDELYQGLAKDTEWHEGAYSMSGRSRDILGECLR